jgi:ectonucleoside triphosphate diphosphohydrolase 5/6
VSGDEGGFQGCLGMARAAVNSFAVDKPKEILNEDIYAFSYYFDKAADAGLIDENTGGKLKVGDYSKAAEHACANHDKGMTALLDSLFIYSFVDEWLCTDLSLITALLESLGLPEEQILQVYKKINGGETAWALGDAFQLI